MRKLVFLLFAILYLFIIHEEWVSGEEIGEHLEYKEIPDEAIRLRILAHSDDDHDQQLKYQIRDKINIEVSKWVGEMTEINQARQVIQTRLPQLERIVAEAIEEFGDGNDFTIEYNHQVTFPAKLYGDFLYPPGDYEAILVTIGEGKGSNWWCVLFPPLCFLDFSNGTTVADDIELEETAEEQEEQAEPEVKFFLLEWLSKF